MKKKISGILILLALASNAVYAAGDDGTKLLLEKYKKVKTYAIDLREENKSLKNEINEIKMNLIEEYKEKLTLKNKDSQEIEALANLEEKTVLEIYMILKELDKVEIIEEKVMETENKDMNTDLEVKMIEAEKTEAVEIKATDIMEEKAE